MARSVSVGYAIDDEHAGRHLPSAHGEKPGACARWQGYGNTEAMLSLFYIVGSMDVYNIV
jgi:hypothetical protein